MCRGKNRTTKTTLRSERSSALKKDLTGPTLLEMYGNATSMIGLCQEGKSSPDALRRSAGVNLFGFFAACVGLSAVVPIRDRTRLPLAVSDQRVVFREDGVGVFLPVSKLISGSNRSLRSFAQSR
jgi:hypothetical protein